MRTSPVAVTCWIIDIGETQSFFESVSDRQRHVRTESECFTLRAVIFDERIDHISPVFRLLHHLHLFHFP